jgi:hypothetical protein
MARFANRDSCAAASTASAQLSQSETDTKERNEVRMQGMGEAALKWREAT